MPGNYQVIRDTFQVSASGTATTYLYSAFLGELNLCFATNVDCTISMYDGYGPFPGLASTSGNVPFTIVPPDNTKFSTGGRTYTSNVKVNGESVTTVSVVLSRVGTWIKIDVNNSEGVTGACRITGEI